MNSRCAANGVVLNPQPITKLPNRTTTAEKLANRAYLSLQARFASKLIYYEHLEQVS